MILPHMLVVLLPSSLFPCLKMDKIRLILQLLRQDRELLGSNSKHPRAVVLCASEEKTEQVTLSLLHTIISLYV
jgi:hypothetical protein